MLREAQDDMPNDYNSLRKLNELVKDIKIAMLTTIRPGGLPHSRPMALQQAEVDGDFWFFTGADSEKSSEVKPNPMVNLSFSNPGDNRYVSVSGTAQIIRDRKKAEELWNPLYKAWFPKGLDDPNLALLKLSVEHVEYWDAPSSTMVQLAGFAKAFLTGQRYQGAEHGEMELHPDSAAG